MYIGNFWIEVRWAHKLRVIDIVVRVINRRSSSPIGNLVEQILIYTSLYLSFLLLISYIVVKLSAA